jgi:dTDP-D-glucose 4,6-dehydratase
VNIKTTKSLFQKLYQSIKDGVEVPVYGDGSQVREWIHAS